MSYNFFLSHYNQDKEIAELIAKCLTRLSLRQIIPWFSSDSTEGGGLKPGSIWFNEVLQKIQQSGALVALLTPNSIDRPWIYFESGIAQALSNCEVIPICVGVKRDTIMPPLGMYQCYQLSDYRSLKEFVGKLLNKFEINFDEEMSKIILETTISELSKIEFTKKDAQEATLNFNQAISDLKNHIDKRFIELIDHQFEDKMIGDGADNFKVKDDTNIMYTVTIDIQFPNYNAEQFLEIRSENSVQDVLDDLWFLLKPYIKPYTYMEDWILQNPSTKQKLVIREIANMVPAKSIFKPSIEWQAIKLERQYKASDSRNPRYFE